MDLNIVCHTAQLSTVQNCIALGLGVSLVPHALAKNDPSDPIKYRTISDSVPQRKIAAAVLARRRLSFLGKAFIEIVSLEYPHGHFE